jgi:carbamate kinase
MIEKLAIIAIGGNSLIEDPKDPSVTRQWEAARKTCRHIADMIVAGWHVVVTHGNGPPSRTATAHRSAIFSGAPRLPQKRAFTMCRST